VRDGLLYAQRWCQRGARIGRARCRCLRYIALELRACVPQIIGGGLASVSVQRYLAKASGFGVDFGVTVVQPNAFYECPITQPAAFLQPDKCDLLSWSSWDSFVGSFFQSSSRFIYRLHIEQVENSVRRYLFIPEKLSGPTRYDRAGFVLPLEATRHSTGNPENLRSHIHAFLRLLACDSRRRRRQVCPGARFSPILSIKLRVH
jgi:hypothetical protein